LDAGDKTIIPDLVESYRSFPRKKLEFVSFLKTSNLTKAKSLIKEKEIRWHQVLLEKKIEEEFKIAGYPTNILLFPDGKSYLTVVGGLNKAFFEKNIH